MLYVSQTAQLLPPEDTGNRRCLKPVAHSEIKTETKQ